MDAHAREVRNVERATAKLAVALAQQHVAMLAAQRAGASTREIARAAGVSHTQVQRLIRQDQASGS